MAEGGRHALQLERHLAGRAGRRLRGTRGLVTADHEADEVALGEPPQLLARAGVAAVAQDCDAVAELEHLLELVAHEHDRDPLAGEAAQEAEQGQGLVRRDRRRGLVEQ